jgi:hypothetical protein
MTVIDYLTGILVFITAIYSYLTYKMAKASEASVQAMREQSEAMLRPYVTISPYVRPHTTVLYLRIENAGRSAAENLRLSMDKDFFQFGEVTQPDHNLRTKAAFGLYIPYKAYRRPGSLYSRWRRVPSSSLPTQIQTRFRSNSQSPRRTDSGKKSSLKPIALTCVPISVVKASATQLLRSLRSFARWPRSGSDV